MRNILASWLISAVCVMITAAVLPGITISGFGGALIAAAAIGIVNSLVRPFLRLITLPITILSLGFFLFVVNAICFSMAAFFAGSAIQIDGFLWAFIGAIVLTAVTSFVDNLFKANDA